MTVLADKLTEALEAKKNDVNSFIWKYGKVRSGKSVTQEQIKLMDASEEELNRFNLHCYTMLYNKDKKHPGRYTLLDLIREQRSCCNVELFLRYMAAGDELTGRKPYPRFSYFQALKTFLKNNEEYLPKDKWNTTPITVITDVPAEFSEITIQQVYQGCLDSLGIFDKKHLTLSFIAKIGLWFSDKEMKDLEERDENGKLINRLSVVKLRHNLKDDIHLHISQNGLSYKEFRAMLNLQSKKYSELTTDQLTILRDKMLFRLEEEVNRHIDQWEDKIAQIEKVAEARNIVLREIVIK